MEEDDAARTAILELFFEDMLFFTNTAIGTWGKHLGKDAALSKVTAGGVCRVAAGGISFAELVEAVAKFDSNVNGYAFLTESITVGASDEWETILQEYPLQEHQVKIALAGCLKIAWQTAGTCFFTTDTHYVGLARQNIQVSDLLCFFFWMQVSCGSQA